MKSSDTGTPPRLKGGRRTRLLASSKNQGLSYRSQNSRGSDYKDTQEGNPQFLETALKTWEPKSYSSEAPDPEEGEEHLKGRGQEPFLGAGAQKTR